MDPYSEPSARHWESTPSYLPLIGSFSLQRPSRSGFREEPSFMITNTKPMYCRRMRVIQCERISQRERVDTRLVLLPEIDCHQPILFHGKTENRLSVYKIEWVGRKALWINYVVLNVTYCMFHAHTINILWFVKSNASTHTHSCFFSMGRRRFSSKYSVQKRECKFARRQNRLAPLPLPPPFHPRIEKPGYWSYEFGPVSNGEGSSWVDTIRARPSCMTGNPKYAEYVGTIHKIRPFSGPGNIYECTWPGNEAGDLR